MNLPNKLSLLRIVLVPLFVVALLWEPTASGLSMWIALAIFALAALTDKLDGTIARKYGLVTNFGKFIDPLADKLLTISAFVCLSIMGLANVYVVLIIIARELGITAFRTVAMESGKVLAADGFGKAKTFLQFFSILAIIAGQIPLISGFAGGIMPVIGQALFIAAGVMTVFSGYNYLAKNWDCIGTDI